MTTKMATDTSATQGAPQPVPAPGAEAQNPNEARDVILTREPAPEADEQNAESDEAKTETPEQIEAKKESRRARQNARKAQALADARAEAKFYREQVEKTQAQPKSQEIGEPKRDDPKYGGTDGYEKYLEDRADWRADQKVDAKLKDRDARQAGEQQRQSLTKAQERIATDWAKREQAFEAKVPEYGKIVGEFVEEGLDDFSTQARQAIVEYGPELLHHLATNLDEVDRIAALSPLRQVAELGKLEEKLAKPAAKRTTSAPEPVKPVSSRATGEKNPEKMSDEEYRKWREGHGASWARQR